MIPENPSSDPPSSSAAPLLPRLFRPREFAAAFQTLNRGFFSCSGRSASTVSSAPASDFTCFCRNTTELGSIALERYCQNWCGKWVEWQERRGAVTKKKNWFCMNFPPEKPRLSSKRQEQSKEKLLKFCSCSYSNHLLEADGISGTRDVKIK